MFWQNKKINILKKEVSESFDNVKKDFTKVGKWINLIDDKTKKHDEKVEIFESKFKELFEKIDEINANLLIIKQPHKQLFKTQTRPLKNMAVQTDVQTAVQTDDFDKLTTSERVILLNLLNSPLKLSYEDLSSQSGKSRSTIRGQINSIKQKIPGAVDEFTEISGKKRVFLSEECKDFLLKKAKIGTKVKKNRKSES